SRFPAIADPPITGQNYPSWWTTFRGLFHYLENPNSLIAFECGLTTPATAFTWDGVRRISDTWNKDQTLAFAFQSRVEIKRNQYERWLASWVAYMFWRDLCFVLKTDMPDARYLLKRTKITYSVLDNTGAFAFEA
ncbi:MAG: hypothetical protein AAFQ15_04430, partial [Pseudomonadota bacterium]